MKLERFKERNTKKIVIYVFTITCIFLVSGVILYRTFAMFEVKINQNVINGKVQGMGDLEFAFYKDNVLVKEVPKKEEGYSLDTSSSYCKDLLNDKQVSNINWDYENWEVRVKNISTTKTKCYLHFKKIYQESILNGAIPDLGNGRLIPVQIKEEQPTGITVQNMNGSYGGKVLKADITDTWYSYADKQWANAVILRDGVVDNYSPGQEILESDIESYFVWIPRYRYRLQDEEGTFNNYFSAEVKGTYSNVQSFYEEIGGNKGASNAFEIEFGSKDIGISPTLLNKGTSIVHPSFEAFDCNGFWVGKFETGYNQNNDRSVMPTDSWQANGALQNIEAFTKVIIKPNVYSWRNIQVANAFYTSYNYQRDLESHMMKNTEWGAVSYLTQSKYGRCTETEGSTTCDEVRINNVGSFITGSSAKNEPTCGYTNSNDLCNIYEILTSLYMDGENSNNYYNSASQVASTTGNYSGIYDMSGGAWETVMGVMQAGEDNHNPTTGPNATNNSGFNGVYSDDSINGSKTNGKEWPSSKYYDLYDFSTSTNKYLRGILGDATKEDGPFYQVSYNSTDFRLISSYNADLAWFPWSTLGTWFNRGDGYSNGTDAGIFAFFGVPGQQNAYQSFRIVLTP